jgi:hypothetical protein
MSDEQRSFRRLDFSGVVPSNILQMIVIDIVCPYMLFPIFSAHVPFVAALLLIALLPLAGIISLRVRKQELDLLGILALFIIAMIFVSDKLEALIPFSPLLAPLFTYALPIGLLGLLILCSQLFRRPIFFYVDRYFYSISLADGVQKYNTYWTNLQPYRQLMYRMNIVWGCTQVLLALSLVALFFLLSQTFFLPFFLLIILTYVALIIWTVQYRSNNVVEGTALQEESEKIKDVF